MRWHRTLVDLDTSELAMLEQILFIIIIVIIVIIIISIVFDRDLGYHAMMLSQTILIASKVA